MPRDSIERCGAADVRGAQHLVEQHALHLLLGLRVGGADDDEIAALHPVARGSAPGAGVEKVVAAPNAAPEVVYGDLARFGGGFVPTGDTAIAYARRPQKGI